MKKWKYTYVRLCLKNFLRSLCAIIFLIQEIDLNVQFFSSCGRSFGMKGRQRNSKKHIYKRIKARSFIVKSSLIVLLNSGQPSLHFSPFNSIHDEICIRNIWKYFCLQFAERVQVTAALRLKHTDWTSNGCCTHFNPIECIASVCAYGWE